MKSENLLALCEKTFEVFPVLFHYFSHFQKIILLFLLYLTFSKCYISCL